MDKRAYDIIDLYYEPGTLSYDVLVRHSELVAGAAVAIARRVDHLGPDVDFIRQAAMLHDIGILYTNSPAIGCTGQYPYVCHGYFGRLLLEKHGLHEHGLVCERHVGTGIGKDEIRRMKLPIPQRDMHPQSIEEQIVCFADAFFSKTPVFEGTVHGVRDVIRLLEKFGKDRVLQFLRWLDMFGAPPEQPGCNKARPAAMSAGDG